MARQSVSVLDALPAPERRTAEMGFTTTPTRAEIIRLAARLSGKKIATYLRELAESDSAQIVAKWRQDREQRGAS